MLHHRETEMTFRIYVRWPSQRVTDRTTTESRGVADTAFSDLKARTSELEEAGAVGIAFTENGAQLDYVRLNDLKRREK